MKHECKPNCFEKTNVRWQFLFNCVQRFVYEILKTERMKILKKTLLYTGALLHLPFTLVRVVVASTLLIDLWCDKVINDWLKEVEKELEDEK